MSCLIHARYNMNMDVLEQTKTQGRSGEVIRTWSVAQTDVPCIARGISGGGIRVVGSTERWSDIHEDVEIIKIQTGYNLSKRTRITNVRAANGNLAWEDEGEPVMFEVVGSTPVMDPFGRVIEYDVMAMRAEIT